jgi:hypothetical protein
MVNGRMYQMIHMAGIGSLLFLLGQCVEPFRPALEAEDAERLLVVEGMITDETGPFSVRLTTSVPVYDDWNVAVNDYLPVPGAAVQIADDMGHVYQLFEAGDGWYETNEKDLHGTPGYAYVLMITTADGREYESTAVSMKAGPDISRLYHEEVQRIYYEREKPYEVTWLNILVDTKPPEDGIVYMKWDFEETWEFEMPTFVTVTHGSCETCPPPSTEVIDVDFEKKHCWVSESSRSILVKSTVDSPDNAIHGFILQSIGPPDDRLNIKYSILVKQYVVDREMYDYFKRIRESNEETGGIYEKTPSQIKGNIRCCNGEELALGYFLASAVRTRRIFILPAEHEVAVGSAYGGCGWTSERPRYGQVYLYGTYNNGTENAYSDNKYCTDCRVRGTHVKPDFWE